ncbi:hypothetical protein [Sphingobacterium cavernae]|uniref:hypothetical protein n=1 Tax=Sphingobacterium cavernae TaxID=2592657 RepID=UPI00123008BD|nr:hypothetical protein [Sphingobacterium cavernae]
MTTIDYFKLQAKNLLKDFKTQSSSFDSKLDRKVYDYDPKFFQIDLLVNDFNINEENFKLGNAQHVIAKLCGLEKWSDLSKASSAKIELSRLLYTNMDRVEVRDWDAYVSGIENENNLKLDDDFKLQIFKDVFLEREQDVYYESYRLSKDEEIDMEWEQEDSISKTSTAKISSLSLTGEDHKKFIKAANRSFDRIIKRIEPEHPELTRSLWNAKRYIDEELLKPDMLPIDRNYALSLIDTFLVHHVIRLAAKADELA